MRGADVALSEADGVREPVGERAVRVQDGHVALAGGEPEEVEAEREVVLGSEDGLEVGDALPADRGETAGAVGTPPEHHGGGDSLGRSGRRDVPDPGRGLLGRVRGTPGPAGGPT